MKKDLSHLMYTFDIREYRLTVNQIDNIASEFYGKVLEPLKPTHEVSVGFGLFVEKILFIRALACFEIKK